MINSCQSDNILARQHRQTSNHQLQHSYKSGTIAPTPESSVLIPRWRALLRNAADNCNEEKLFIFCRLHTARVVSFLTLPVQKQQKRCLFCTSAADFHWLKIDKPSVGQLAPTGHSALLGWIEVKFVAVHFNSKECLSVNARMLVFAQFSCALLCNAAREKKR